MTENNIKIVMKDNYKEVKSPSIIIGFPSTGLVGLIGALHIIDSMKMEYCGYLESKNFPPIVLIHDNELVLPLRIYQKGNLLVVISEISLPQDPTTSSDIAITITNWVKILDPEFLIILRGNPVENRMNIDIPNCYGLGVSKKLNSIVKKSECELMNHGIISGIDAILLWEALKQDLPAITLAADAFPQLPDPGASAVLLEKLNKILNLNIDSAKLLENAEDLRIKMRDTMRNTSTLQKGLQNKESQLPPMYG